MVSVFRYAEEWTSSGGTWEGMRLGPVGSECSESGRKNYIKDKQRCMRHDFNSSNYFYYELTLCGDIVALRTQMFSESFSSS